MLDKAYIRRKLSSLLGYLKELDAISGSTFVEYKADEDYLQRGATRRVRKK